MLGPDGPRPTASKRRRLLLFGGAALVVVALGLGSGACAASRPQPARDGNVAALAALRAHEPRRHRRGRILR